MSFDNYEEWDTPPSYRPSKMFWRYIGAGLCFVAALILAYYLFLI